LDILQVYNKIDQVDEQYLETIKKRYPRARFISAARREGLEEVRQHIEQHFKNENILVEVEISARDGKNIAMIGSLLQNMEKSYRGDQCLIKGTVDRSQMNRLEQISGAKVRYLL
jgi:50S ribosomal subunit-associated GTPase HflX